MSTQTLTGIHLFGDGTPVAGRVVKATPVPGQFVDASTVDAAAVVTSDTTGSDGAWALTLLSGVVYDIKIEKWGVRTIQISADAEKAFVTYLGEAPEMSGVVPGSVKFETGESVVFFLFQDVNGAYQLGWRVVA